jgi:hypothetical protein
MQENLGLWRNEDILKKVRFSSVQMYMKYKEIDRRELPDILNIWQDLLEYYLEYSFGPDIQGQLTEIVWHLILYFPSVWMSNGLIANLYKNTVIPFANALHIRVGRYWN